MCRVRHHGAACHCATSHRATVIAPPVIAPQLYVAAVGAAGSSLRMNQIQQRLFDAIGIAGGQARQNSRVPSECNDDDGRENCDTEATTQPFSNSKRALHCNEDPAADNGRDRKRSHGAKA